MNEREDFFDQAVAAAREEVLRREREEQAKAVVKKKPSAHFVPFREAIRRVESKFDGSTEVDFQFEKITSESCSENTA